MTKPVDLIVANTMHESLAVVDQIGAIVRAAKRIAPPLDLALPDVHAEIARKLLCSISHDAAISVVFLVLKAVGAPASNESIADGLQAVRDLQK